MGGRVATEDLRRGSSGARSRAHQNRSQSYSQRGRPVDSQHHLEGDESPPPQPVKLRIQPRKSLRRFAPEIPEGQSPVIAPRQRRPRIVPDRQRLPQLPAEVVRRPLSGHADPDEDRERSHDQPGGQVHVHDDTRIHPRSRASTSGAVNAPPRNASPECILSLLLL